MKFRASLAIAVVSLFACNAAFAHSGTGLAGGFASGFRHPIAGVDHLLAMVAVGLWGGILGRPLIYVLPVVFPLVMVIGAAIGMFGFPLPAPEIGVALSAIVLGACVASTLRAPVWSASLLVGAFAIFHGYAHGVELPSAADPIGYSAGFVFATGLLHLAGIAIGALAHWRGGAIVARGAGAIVALAGAGYLHQALTS